MAKRKAPRAGSKLAWVAERLQYSNVELAELAHEAGLGLTKRKVSRLRNRLRAQYGITRDSAARPSARPTAAARPAARPAARRAAGQPDARQLKRLALRKLVFELGFDDAREIFEEFLDMHHRMGGNGS